MGLKSIRNFIKTLCRMVKSYESDKARMEKAIADYHDAKVALSAIKAEYERVHAVLFDGTTIHADVHCKSDGDRNQVIVIGRYRNADYINVFDLPDNDMRHLIDTLREQSRDGRIGRIDAMPGMKQMIIHDMEKI
jgi:hypothetical protein